jgi:glyoxylase-like metal-dependent hydrolase (beta-lactamase superfamily II)
MVHTIDLLFLNTKQTIAAYLLDTGSGLALVETGPYSTFEHLKKGIAAYGAEVEDIQHVLLTHIHLDHAGSAWALAEGGADIYVHPIGVRHLHDPSKLMSSAKRIYEDKLEELWGTMKGIPEDKLKPVEHGAHIKMGQIHWTAWHTPGHAVHHIAWQLDKAIFTGDVAGVRIDKGIVVPPCPPPDIDIEDWQESIQLLRAQSPEALYLTHFGKTSNVNVHLDELEDRLLSWANWMRPHYQAGASVEDVTPAFQNFVRDELKENGVTGEQLLKYEYANPSWMSVSGLLRYWRKKEERTSRDDSGNH